MRNFEGIADAADSVRRFFFTNQAQLPEHVTKAIEPHVGTGSSPVDLIVNFTEAVFANRKDVPAEASLIAAGTADIIQQNGYHNRLDDRAAGIMKALRRDQGEKGNWPKPENDPDARQAFLPPPAVEEPPPAASEG